MTHVRPFVISVIFSNCLALRAEACLTGLDLLDVASCGNYFFFLLWPLTSTWLWWHSVYKHIQRSCTFVMSFSSSSRWGQVSLAASITVPVGPQQSSCKHTRHRMFRQTETNQQDACLLISKAFLEGVVFTFGLVYLNTQTWHWSPHLTLTESDWVNPLRCVSLKLTFETQSVTGTKGELKWSRRGSPHAGSAAVSFWGSHLLTSYTCRRSACSMLWYRSPPATPEPARERSTLRSDTAPLCLLYLYQHFILFFVFLSQALFFPLLFSSSCCFFFCVFWSL